MNKPPPKTARPDPPLGTHPGGASTEISTAQRTDRQLQQARLRQFLVFMFPIALGFGALYGTAALLLGSSTLGWASLNVLGYAVAVWVAMRLSVRGHVELAAQTTAYGLFGMAFFGNLVVPFLFPLLLLLPLAGVTLVLPYLEGRRLRLLLQVAFALEVLTVALNTLGWPRPALPPAWLRELVSAAATTFAVGLIFLLLWQDSRRLKQSLAAVVQTDAERRRLGDRFQQLTLATAQIVWTTTATGEVLEDSLSWRHFTGQSYEEWKGWGWLSAVHPDDRARVQAAWTRAVAQRQTYEVEYRLQRTDLGWANLVARGIPVLDPDGSVREWVGTCTDITPERTAQAERERLLLAEQAARRVAEEASHLKDEFLATVSHELRTPLTAMLGWLHLLRSGALTPERAEQALVTVERNARAQAQLIEDLLDVSRIVSGKLRLDVTQVELGSVVLAALESLRPAAEAKSIRLEPVLGTTAPLQGDANRLQQVAWNLLSNAVKFTPKGGRVQVIVRQEHSAAELIVADNGQGISPAFLPHVFERFRQSESATTRTKGGLGLGLAIVRHLVELHGGTVRASSAGEGQGATFLMRIPTPLVSAQPHLNTLRPPLPQPPPPHPDLEGLRVLVVEDEPDTREYLRVLLERSGLRVRTAASSTEALAAIAAEVPQLLISDVGMPEEDGYQLIQKVRALAPEHGGRVPAIALTAYARVEDRQRALYAGFTMHVPKPLEPSELLAVISSLAIQLRA